MQCFRSQEEDLCVEKIVLIPSLSKGNQEFVLELYYEMKKSPDKYWVFKELLKYGSRSRVYNALKWLVKMDMVRMIKSQPRFYYVNVKWGKQ
jgi:hypothetical protein